MLPPLLHGTAPDKKSDDTDPGVVEKSDTTDPDATKKSEDEKLDGVDKTLDDPNTCKGYKKPSGITFGSNSKAYDDKKTFNRKPGIYFNI